MQAQPKKPTFDLERMYLGHAEEHEKKGDIKQALKSLEKCAQKLKETILEMEGYKSSNPDPITFHNHDKNDYIEVRSKILYEMGEFEEAEKGFKTLIDEGPENRKHYFYKSYADCLRKRHAYEESIENYGKAAEGFKAPKEISEVRALLTNRDIPAKEKSAMAAMLNNRGLSYIELQQYEKAVNDFDLATVLEDDRPRALYTCNKGQANYLLGDREAALKNFKTANSLIQKKARTESGTDFSNYLRKDQVNYIQKKLGDLINELDQLEKIKLKIQDEIIVSREKKYVQEIINECNAPKNETDATQEKEKDWEKFIQILDSKQKLELIQDNALLYQYYDGFLYTLSQGYVVATVVNSDKLSVNTGNNAVSAVSTLVSLIPMVGSQVSEGINKVWEFVKDAQIKKAAVNVCSFATTVTEFESMAQEVAINVILQKKAEIETLNPQTYLLPTWMQKFKQLIEKLNANIYGERNQTPMQKLGYQTASSLIEQYIASGQIYDNQPPVCVLPKQRKSKLLDVSLALLNQNIEESNKELVKEETPGGTSKNEKEDNRSACCEMF